MRYVSLELFTTKVAAQLKFYCAMLGNFETIVRLHCKFSVLWNESKISNYNECII